MQSSAARELHSDSVPIIIATRLGNFIPRLVFFFYPLLLLYFAIYAAILSIFRNVYNHVAESAVLCVANTTLKSHSANWKNDAIETIATTEHSITFYTINTTLSISILIWWWECKNVYDEMYNLKRWKIKLHVFLCGLYRWSQSVLSQVKHKVGVLTSLWIFHSKAFIGALFLCEFNCWFMSIPSIWWWCLSQKHFSCGALSLVSIVRKQPTFIRDTKYVRVDQKIDNFFEGMQLFKSICISYEFIFSFFFWWKIAISRKLPTHSAMKSTQMLISFTKSNKSCDILSSILSSQ